MTVDIGLPEETVVYEISTDGRGKKIFRPLNAVFNTKFSGFVDRPNTQRFFIALSNFVDRWNVDNP